MSTNDQFAIPVPARSRRYLRARRRPMVTGIHGMNSIDVGLLAWPGSGGHVEYPLKLPDNPERKNYDAKTLNRCGDYYYDMAQYRLVSSKSYDSSICYVKVQPDIFPLPQRL